MSAAKKAGDAKPAASAPADEEVLAADDATGAVVRVQVMPNRSVRVGDRLYGPDEVVEVPEADAKTLEAEGYTLDPESTKLTDAVRAQNAERRERAAAESEQAREEAVETAQEARGRASDLEAEQEAIARGRERNAHRHHEPAGD